MIAGRWCHAMNDINRVCTLLDREGLKYDPDFEMQSLELGMICENGKYRMRILVEEHALSFFVLDLATLPASQPNFTRALKKLLELNFANKVVKYGRDPRDGEIRAQFTWLSDRPIRIEELTLIIHLMFVGVDEDYPHIQRAIWGDREPGPSGADDQEEAPEDVGPEDELA